MSSLSSVASSYQPQTATVSSTSRLQPTATRAMRAVRGPRRQLQILMIVLLSSALAVVLAPAKHAITLEAAPSPTRTPTTTSASLSKRITFYSGYAARNSMAWSANGRYLADVDHAGVVNIFDARRGSVLKTLEGLPTQGGGSIDNGVAFSPDSRYVLSGNDEGVVHIWDVETGVLIRRLLGLGKAVSSVAWSPGGNLVAAAGDDIIVWEVATGKRKPLQAAGPEAIVFSPDGTLLAAGSSNGHAYIWDAATGELLHTLAVCAFSLSALAFSPDGTILATGTNDDKDQQIKLWDVKTGQLLLAAATGHRDQVITLAWSPNGRLIASLSLHNRLLIWNAVTHQLLFTEPVADYTSALAWSPDSTQLAVGEWDHIYIYNLAAYPEASALLTDGYPTPSAQVTVAIGTPEPLPTPTRVPAPLPVRAQITPPTAYSGPLPKDAVAQLGLGSLYDTLPSPDQTRLAVSSSIGLTVFSLNSLKALWTTRTRYRLGKLEWSPDSQRIAAASDEVDSPQGLIIDAQTGAILHELTGHTRRIFALDWSSGGSQLVTGGRDGAAILWNAGTGQAVRRMVRTGTDGMRSDAPGSEYHVNDVAFSADDLVVAGSFLFGGGDYGEIDHYVALWDTRTGEQIGLLEADSGVAAMVWSPTQPSSLAVGLENSRVLIFDTATQKAVAELKALSSIESLHWSPDGGILIAIDRRGGLSAWDMKSYSDRYVHERAGLQFIWANDGQRFATMHEYARNFPYTTVWDTRTGRELTRLDGFAFRSFMQGSAQIIGQDLYSDQLSTRDAATGQKLGSSDSALIGSQPIESVAWSPDGSKIATGTSVVTVWKVASGTPLYSLSPEEQDWGAAVVVAWSSDGKLLATGGNHLKLWEAATGQPFALKLPDFAVEDLAFSPDGRVLAALEESNVHLIEIPTGREHLIAVAGAARRLAWSPDGARLVVLVADDSAYVVDAIAGKLGLKIALNVTQKYGQGPTALAWSPDGEEIAVSVEMQRIDVYDSATGVLRRALGLYLYQNDTDIEGYYNDTAISSLAWSGDGKTIAAAYGVARGTMVDIAYMIRPSRPVILWDARTGARLQTLRGHTAEVQVVVFSPDSSMLASGGNDGVGYIWLPQNHENEPTLSPIGRLRGHGG